MWMCELRKRPRHREKRIAIAGLYVVGERGEVGFWSDDMTTLLSSLQLLRALCSKIGNALCAQSSLSLSLASSWWENTTKTYNYTVHTYMYVSSFLVREILIHMNQQQLTQTFSIHPRGTHNSTFSNCRISLDSWRRILYLFVLSYKMLFLPILFFKFSHIVKCIIVSYMRVYYIDMIW